MGHGEPGNGLERVIGSLASRQGDRIVPGSKGVDRVEMSPEQREAYRQFAETTRNLFANRKVLRHNGMEVMQLGLPEDHPSDRRPLIGLSRKLGSSLSEIPKDVPISQWGDYIFDMGAMGKRSEPNTTLSLIESSLPYKAEYELKPDGSVSRGLFDLDTGNQLDFQPLAPVAEVKNLNLALPDCIDVNWNHATGSGVVPPE